jgi:hypothetical protein
MTPPDNRASPEACDADNQCLHVPCFQVQLDGTRPRQAHQRANACAYHVADVIEALRRWAAEHGVVDGALTILAIEPAAGGRQPTGEDRPDLRGFAFSTIPLDSGPRRDPQPDAGRTGTGHALRQNALEPGFHGVPAGPTHPDRDADGAGVV